MSRKAKIVSLPVASLVEDMEIYPRHAVDAAHVRALVLAMEAGAELPPIVADAESKRITDGWHRARAKQRLFGEAAKVDVELVRYADTAEMKLDAVRRNAAHGRRLDAIDRTRCVIMLRAAGVGDGAISDAMGIPERRVEKLLVKVATAPKSSGQTVPGTSEICLKGSVAHLDGKTLTKAQAQTHAKLPGTSFLLVARQLYLALRDDMVDLADRRLVKQLDELREMLERKVVEPAA